MDELGESVTTKTSLGSKAPVEALDEQILSHRADQEEKTNEGTTENPGDNVEKNDNQRATNLEALSMDSRRPLYTVFSRRMVWWIVIMNCLSAFISPITANIYFPVIPQLARDLGVSTAQINLTVTTYMIMQGLAPLFFGEFGDSAGRRPAFIMSFSIYLCANVGLALQRSFPVLLVLRMLQSAGSSGTTALIYAVVADISPHSERGKYMGIVGAGFTVGPALGPLLGGLITQYLGWPAIFWFLVIFTACWLVPYILYVPETGRQVVGNGSVAPRGWNMTAVDYIRLRKHHDTQEHHGKQRMRIPIPNPLNTIKVIFQKGMALLLFYNGCLFMSIILITSTLSTQFAESYHYDTLTLSLCYLPIGFSTVIASVGNGFVIDWNYRRVARNLSIEIDRKRGDDLSKLPIEKIRLQLTFPMIVIGTAIYLAYGWSLHFRLHVAVPLVLSFFIGYFITGTFQIINLMIVDVHPDAPAMATAANNLVRGSFGALAVAVIEPMFQVMGIGWAYTFFALLSFVLSPILIVILKYGAQWRAEQARKKQPAEVAQEAVTTDKS
ncbi:hypothetical protein G7054_g15227 [Neopestalotiopsis clavispora]|nr:hypothetical protein G7054_g15227 [Neopestalotiopsis clavispora]